jgi:(p)ppGpp synthase/HD superfamily hydrolase
VSLLLKRALDVAAVWHRYQRRKYPNVDVPYVSHVAGVAIILARHGFDAEVVAAGALHDCIEDCSVTHDELALRFGARIASLVRNVSETDKTLSWEIRKAQYLEHFSAKEWAAQAISLADKIDNFQSIVLCQSDHGDPWPMFKRGRDAQMAKFEELLVRARALAPHPLIDEFAKSLDEVRDLPPSRSP